MFADSSTAQIVGVGVGTLTVGGALSWAILQITPAIKERLSRPAKTAEVAKPESNGNGSNGKSGEKPVSFWDGKLERLDDKLERQDKTLNRVCAVLENQDKTMNRVCDILEAQERRREIEDAVMRKAAAV